jgi:hypothetical protein
MEEVKASVQYGDLRGDVACDGHQGVLLHELAEKAKLPKEYVPLAVDVYVGEHGFLDVALFACEKNAYGDDIDEIQAKGRAAGDIKVKKFAVKIDADDLLRLVKRLHIVARHRRVADIPLVTPDPL